MHKSEFKTGVLLVNLGTPDSPETPEVRKYLREFLMDGRVIDVPFPIRWALVNLIIAPFRAPKSSKTYKKLWEERGSPLKFYGQDIEKMVQVALGDAYHVKLAMRYQNPSMEVGLEEFRQQGLKKIIIIPLFPQYASATTGSIYEKAMKIVSNWQTIPEIRYTNQFYDHPLFVKHFVEAGKRHRELKNYDHLLFSYHGVPARHIRKGDYTPEKSQCKFGSCCDTLGLHNQLCYRAQCFATTRALAGAMGLQEGSYSTAFQSRLGRDPWLEPYTEDVVQSLPKEGKKNVLVFSGAFVADCLETTIEIGEEYFELFEENGGEHFQLVESLNNSDLFVDLLVDLVKNDKN
jgi:protoporphyrin/coproporphyrin ferrochelatase